MEPTVIQPAKKDLYYFVRYLLFEECVRVAVKRGQTPRFDSFGLERSGKLPIRDSDLRERSYACIEALVKIGGYSIDKAAAEVADVLGRKTSSKAGGIRVGYYEVRKTFRGRTVPLSIWFIDFFGWRDWVLSSDDFTIWFALQRYQERFARIRARRIAALMIEMRSDPVQAARNTVWHEASAPGCRSFVPEP
jgi:hypothetical protein